MGVGVHHAGPTGDARGTALPARVAIRARPDHRDRARALDGGQALRDGVAGHGVHLGGARGEDSRGGRRRGRARRGRDHLQLHTYAQLDELFTRRVPRAVPRDAGRRRAAASAAGRPARGRGGDAVCGRPHRGRDIARVGGPRPRRRELRAGVRSGRLQPAAGVPPRERKRRQRDVRRLRRPELRALRGHGRPRRQRALHVGCRRQPDRRRGRRAVPGAGHGAALVHLGRLLGARARAHPRKARERVRAAAVRGVRRPEPARPRAHL
ncbi:MAG: hypothetical protein BWY81_01544 [Firmicutes bacterium ADurb.Bin467]|nr:MAG: hypothetical protein BWY81_01544 [Firmicutes bacterium ADurb.Bin467]